MYRSLSHLTSLHAALKVALSDAEYLETWRHFLTHDDDRLRWEAFKEWCNRRMGKPPNINLNAGITPTGDQPALSDATIDAIVGDLKAKAIEVEYRPVNPKTSQQIDAELGTDADCARISRTAHQAAALTPAAPTSDDAIRAAKEAGLV